MEKRFADCGARVVGVSSDPPEVNLKFIEKYNLPYPILSDAGHALTQALSVGVSTQHPMAKIRKYPHGFSQPAVFIVDREGREKFAWRQQSKITNAFGAARRMEPEQILEAARQLDNG